MVGLLSVMYKRRVPSTSVPEKAVAAGTGVTVRDAFANTFAKQRPRFGPDRTEDHGRAATLEKSNREWRTEHQPVYAQRALAHAASAPAIRAPRVACRQAAKRV